MTPDERKILEEAEQQAFDTAQAFYDVPTSGIRPPPAIDETETVLDPQLFGFDFGQQPTTEVLPTTSSEGGDCCPRDVTEINLLQFAFSASYTGGSDPPGCDPYYDPSCIFCGGDSCSNSVALTRIPYLDSYSAPNQFKLWLDADCQIHFDTNASPWLIRFGCASSSFYVNYLFTLTAFTFVTGPPAYLTLGFNFVASSINCDGCNCPDSSCSATFADTNIPIDKCDFSNLLGNHTVSNTCTDANGFVWTINYAQLNVF